MLEFKHHNSKASASTVGRTGKKKGEGFLQMISIENPTCSSKASSASDLVPASTGHGDEQPQPCNFSIRDYVFKSRSKDIRINWPFREQLLQLCLDNGISDLLPPLELPTLVKAHCLKKQVESERLPKCAENKAILWNGESMEDAAELESSLPLDSLLVASSVQPFKAQEESIPEINASSVTSHDLSEGISGEQLKKKWRLAAAPIFAGGSGSGSTPEGLVSNSITASDPMASKVCPVCKSFTSTSNTTLNAHIDQCLSSDQSNGTRDETEFPKPKGKPMKKRLMVDIYTTAPHCTLEDLDRRNGTNWAAGLAPVAPANDVSLETKRMKLLPPDAAVGEGNNVGDIYIDSNGTKLLVLSNDPPAPASPKNSKLKKHAKGFKAGQCYSLTKKKILKPKCSKFMKDNSRNLNLSMVQGFEGEVDTTKRNHVAEAHQEKEESGSQLLNAHDEVRNGEPSTLGHWVCSKRSDLSRKPDNKVINKGSKKIVFARKLSFRDTRPDSPDSSIQKNHALNLPSSSQAVALPKTKCMDILSSTARGLDSGRKISLQSSNLNSRLLYESVSLADSHVANISSPNESCHPSFKARKSLTPKKSYFSRRTCISLEEMEVDKSERFVTPKKFKKSRSKLGCSKRRGRERYSDVNGGSDGSSEDFGFISPRATETGKIHQYINFSENQEKGRFGMIDPMSTGNDEIAYGASLEDPSLGEHAESISRDEAEVGGERYSDETEVELPPERSTSYQEAQCGDAISNEVISQDIQISGYQAEPMLQNGERQTDTSSIQDPNPCVTTDGAMGLDNTQENSSTLIRVESSQDHNMIVDMESSGSAVSTTSSISPSPVDDKIKDLEADRLAEPLLDKSSFLIARKDNNVNMCPPAREPLCSCSESLSRESQFSNYRKSGASSNLFLRPPTFSSFQQVLPNLESHNESVLTMDSSKSATNISNPCSQSQSASNPILRLMGKDLVVNKGESVRLPTILPCDPDYTSEAKFVSFGLPNNVGFISYQNPYTYQIQALPPNHHQIPVQPLQRLDKFNSPSVWSMDRMAAPLHPRPKPIMHSYQAQEVIVIDDDSPGGLEPEPRANLTTLPQAVQTPNHMAPQRLFACFPSQNPNPYAPRAFTSSQRETSEGSFMFPSPLSLYFSPALR